MAGQIRKPRRTVSSYQPSMQPLRPTIPKTNAGLINASQNAGQAIDNIDAVLKEDNPTYEGSPTDVLGQEKAAARNSGVAGGVAGSGIGGGTGAKISSGGISGSGSGEAKSAIEGSASENARAKLKSKEEAAPGGGLYREDGTAKKKKGGITRFAASVGRKRLAVMAASLVAAVVTAIFAAFSSLLPLKTLSIAQYIEDKAYAAFNSATENGMDRLLTAYIKRYVIPSLAQGCASTRVNRNCMMRITANDPLSALFARWQGKGQQSLETKLAERGYEIKRGNGTYQMTIPGAGNEPVDLTDVANGRENNITRTMGRAEVRANFRQAVEGEGFFKKALFRYRVGKLLERKYGIERCIIACNFRDDFHDKIDVKKRAFQAYFIRRFIEPRSAMLGVALGCLVNACSDTPESGGINDPNSIENGEPTDDFDRQTREALARARTAFGSDKIDKLVANLGEIDKDGFSRFILKNMVQKGGDLLGKEISDDLARKLVGPTGPVAWVLAIGKLLYFVDHGGMALKKMTYVVNSAGMVTAFYLFRTTADEERSGHMDPAMFGSFASALNSGYSGKGQPAEASPLYDNYFSSGANSAVAAAVKSLLPQKAYAQAIAPGTEAEVAANEAKCNDGSSVQSNQDAEVKASNNVCPELRLTYGNWFTDLASFIRNFPILGPILSVFGDILETINDIVDKIMTILAPAFEFIFNALFPGVLEPLKAIFGDIARAITNWLVDKIIPPLTPEGGPDGARLVDLAIGGGTVAGAESAHRLLGGKVLDTAEQIAIQKEQDQLQQEEFASKSLYQRMFDTTDTQSFVSQLALATPGNPGQALENTLGSLLSNPVGTMSKYFAGAIGTRAAHAAPIDNPFGVAEYGIPLSNDAFKGDPVDWYATNCADGKINEAYNTAKEDIEDPALQQYGYTINQDSFMLQNDVANPCLMYNQLANYDQLPKEDAAGGGSGGGTLVGSGPTCSNGLAASKAPAGYTLKGCEDWSTAGNFGQFHPYDGGGDGTVNGTFRTAAACTVENDLLVLTQQAGTGTCGGSMDDATFANQYGYWRVRMAVTGPQSDAHPVLITWPVNDQWPAGAEYDYVEVNSGDDCLGAFLHYPNHQPKVQEAAQKCPYTLTDFHEYALEWLPDTLIGYEDGNEWFRFDGQVAHAPFPMRQTIQLDNLGSGPPNEPVKMQIDWAQLYVK